MSKLRDTYQAIVDRVKSDSTFRDYFKQLEVSETTEIKSVPCVTIGPPYIDTEPYTIPKGEKIEMNIPFQYIVKNSDNDKIVYEHLKAVEIFVNAYFGSDPTFSGKILRSSFGFEPPESQENNSIVGTGVINIELQIASQGTL